MDYEVCYRKTLCCQRERFIDQKMTMDKREFGFVFSPIALYTALTMPLAYGLSIRGILWSCGLR